MGKRALRVKTAAPLFTVMCIIGKNFVPGAFAQAVPSSTNPAVPTTANQAPPVQNENIVPNRITGFTAWDDEFLYVAVQVSKPSLTGTNKTPFSDPLNDDCIVISLQTDNDHKSTARNTRTISIAVSNAGGKQVYSGAKSTPMFNSFQDLQDKLAAIDKSGADQNTQLAQRVALLGSIPRIQVVPTGAPRPGAANYPGYTTELAIPWADLGGRPDVGARMGFNVTALSKSVGSPKTLSLAPGVHGVSDLDNPSLWGELVFNNTAKVGNTLEHTSPRVIASKPEVDGIINVSEWNRLSGFEFGELGGTNPNLSLTTTIAARSRPDFTPQPARPGVLMPVAKPVSNVKPHAAHHVDHLVFARYEYGYQADTRKSVATQMVFNPDHSSALAHHPLDGAGPWFSYDHADWHRNSLVELRRAGVDVILPIYKADIQHRKAYADKGLTVLVTALTDLKRSRQEYPQVGLSLDCNSLVDIAGDKLDLKEPANQVLIYKVIREFYSKIPADFRCTISGDTTEGYRAAYPVFLSDVGAFKDWDSTFTTSIRSQFRSDPAFNGADLVFVGPGQFGVKAGLDSYVEKPLDPSAATGGWIKTVSVGAGYDVDVARNFSADASGLTPRLEGTTYRGEWAAAIAKKPDWILLPNWNDYQLGGEIAPTLETGFGSSDDTKIFTRAFNGLDQKFRAKFIWNDTPSIMASKSRSTVHVRLQNGGSAIWGVGSSNQLPVNIVYRWTQNGQTVATDSEIVVAGTVIPGSEVTVPIRVQTAIKGTVLADGNYTLEIAAANGKQSPWASDTVVKVPVTIGSDASPVGSITIVDSDMPVILETGSVYPVVARLRNDGTKTWTKGSHRVAARLYRITETTASKSMETLIPTADSSVAMDRDVSPGEEADVHLNFALLDSAGKAIPVEDTTVGSSFAIRWEVSADGGSVAPVAANEGPGSTEGSGSGSASTLQRIGLSEFDFGVRFTQDGTLKTLPGQRRVPIMLGFRNVGPQTWKRDSVRIGYHWYYQDGSEFLWEDETTALPQDVPPGGTVNGLLAWVTAPPCDGNYYLVWDVKFGDTWASTSAASRVADEQVHSIQVTGGKLIFTDLTKAFSVDGVSELSTPKDGDFDGKGATFPAALIPPFTDDGVVPAGIWQPYERTGPESPRRISFKWGSKEPKSKNFLICNGQRLDLGKFTGKCRVVHIVAASINANVSTSIKLVFQEPSSESEDLYAFSVSRWDQPPVNGEEIVFSSRRHHDGAGSTEGAVSLYHYTFVIRDPRKIAALKLPNEPNIRIAAVTLEQ